MNEPWPFVFVDEVRYGDLDANRHLNNVAVHQFFESARIAYLEALLPHLDSAEGGTGFPIIFAETHVTFRSPGAYRDELHVHVRPEGLRRSSVRIAFRIVCAADDRLVADGWGTVVGYDYDTGRAAPLTPELTAALRAAGGDREPSGD